MSDMKAALKKGLTVKVKFTKKDGTLRTLIGTINFDRIPKVDHPRNTGKAETAGVQRIYDLEIGEWRSVILSSIKEWEETQYEMA
jgi:hypothetical protein